MSTKGVSCIVMVCDGCGGEFEHDYTPHYPDICMGREEAEYYEWRTDGTSDWCPSCQTNPHECADTPAAPDFCVRCGSELGTEETP